MTSTDRVVIEGSIVRHERVEVMAESALSEFENHLVRYEATTFPVLPHGTVLLSYDRNAGQGFILVEQKPQRVNIGVAHSTRGRYPEDANHNRVAGIDRFNIQFPYQYFAIKFRLGVNAQGIPFNFTMDGYNLYWRKMPFTQPDDRLWVAAVPNVNDGGGICWGGTLDFAPNDNMAVRVNAMVNNFAHTTFNEDLGHRTPFGHSLTQWEQDSENPLNFMNWDYWENGRSFPATEIMDLMMQQPLPIAQINPFHIDIPPLPENFTVGRARQWINGLDEGTRRRILLAITETAEDLGEPIPTPEQITEALETPDETPA